MAGSLAQFLESQADVTGWLEANLLYFPNGVSTMNSQTHLLCGPAISGSEIRQAVEAEREYRERCLRPERQRGYDWVLPNYRHAQLSILPLVRIARRNGHDCRIDYDQFCEHVGVTKEYAIGFLDGYCEFEKRPTITEEYAAGYVEGIRAIRS